MVQAFGCIDGTRIPIACPRANSQDLFCYKKYYSFNVQAVCDYQGLFMDVDCRWHGSAHDSKVYTNSAINKKMRCGDLPVCLQALTESTKKIPNYLIGDPAYPLTPFSMKEYDHCSSNEQVIFNNLLRGARNPIECAFGRLKARWSILTRNMDLKLHNIPVVIYAGFVLHKYCEQHNIYVDEKQVKVQMELMKQNKEAHKHSPDPIYSCNTDEGEITRKFITEYLVKFL